MKKVIRFGVPQVFIKEPLSYPYSPSQKIGSAKIDRVHFEKQFSTFFWKLREKKSEKGHQIWCAPSFY